MEGAGRHHLPLEGMGREVVREIRNGVRVEMAAADDFQSFTVSDGRHIGRVSGWHYWSFAAPLDPSTAPTVDSPGTLVTPDGKQSEVSVVAVGDESITLAVEDDLGEQLPRAEVTLDPAAILGRLSERLADLEVTGADTTLIEDFLSPSVLTEVADEQSGDTARWAPPNADEEQQRAAERAVEPGVRFTWGPPGTGKTRVLGHAVGIAARRGDDVLVLAHANAAVDVAAARIAAELDGEELLEEGRVLRVGNVPTTAPELAQVLPDRVVKERWPGLVDKLSVLDEERRELSDRIRAVGDATGELAERLAEVRSELRFAERARREAIRDAMDDASVIVTTLSRAIIDDRLWDREWDVVMVDEASMAPLAMVLALALRGPTTLSLLGDPRQLPPVHRSDEPAARLWFRRDVFDYGGITAGDHDPGADLRLSALRIQFRMGETICAAVDELAYKGMLRTHSSARDRGIRLADAHPSPSYEVIVVDTSPLGTRCWPDPEPGSFSRINPMSGALAVTAAVQLRDSGCASVALISPYRSQVRWLSALAQGTGRVSASTVHRLQGGEADGVVLDLTDAAPMDRPSKLTNDGDLAIRLLTVAASRARGKLVLLVDLSFVHERVPLGGPMRQLLDAAASVDAAELNGLELLHDSDGSATLSLLPFRWLDAAAPRGWSTMAPKSGRRRGTASWCIRTRRERRRCCCTTSASPRRSAMTSLRRARVGVGANGAVDS